MFLPVDVCGGGTSSPPDVKGSGPDAWNCFRSWGGLGAALLVSSLTFSSPNSTEGFVSFPSRTR